jgi:hypothetical protein
MNRSKLVLSFVQEDRVDSRSLRIFKCITIYVPWLNMLLEIIFDSALSSILPQCYDVLKYEHLKMTF